MESTKPIVKSPSGRSFERIAARVPPGVASAIRSTPLYGDLLTINPGELLSYPDQVLKVNTLVLHPGARILMLANRNPWLAIVARRIRFASRRELAEIGINPHYRAVLEPRPPPSLGSAAAGTKGRPGKDGTPGAAGVDGINGAPGGDAPVAPTFYLVAGNVTVQDGRPDDLKLTIWHFGRYAAPGGDGQNGQNGGVGGAGGKGVWNGGDCDPHPGDGGRGGSAGGGGDGGAAGRNSPGGTVHLAGSAQALDVLEHAVIKNEGRPGQPGGAAGENGSPGAGGARGSRPGGCDGGHDGLPGDASPRRPRPGAFGLDGLPGQNLSETIDIATLY